MGPQTGRWARKRELGTDPQKRVADSVATIRSKPIGSEVVGVYQMCAKRPRSASADSRNHVGLSEESSRLQVASTKLHEPISRRFVAIIKQFVPDHAIPMICFGKGQRNDEVAATTGQLLERRSSAFLCEGPGQMYGLSNRQTVANRDRQKPCLIVKSAVLVNQCCSDSVNWDLPTSF